jgi:hypothetical protein
MVRFLTHLEEEEEQLPAVTPERLEDAQHAAVVMLSI